LTWRGVAPPVSGPHESDARHAASIGPVGRQRGVAAAGGATLYFAFPLLYARPLSRFLSALMIVLWLLIARVSCSAQPHERGRWRALLTGFRLASALLTISRRRLANVLRGVPLQAMATSFCLCGPTGSPATARHLDWYTVIAACWRCALTLHGALWSAIRPQANSPHAPHIVTALLRWRLSPSSASRHHLRARGQPGQLLQLSATFIVPVGVAASLLESGSSSQGPAGEGVSIFLPLSSHAGRRLLEPLSTLCPRPPARSVTSPQPHPGPATTLASACLVELRHGPAICYIVFVYSRFRARWIGRDGH